MNEITALAFKPKMPVWLLFASKADTPISAVISFLAPVQHEVRFYAAEHGMIMTFRYDQHGTVYDDNGRVVHVYEFPQEVKQ